MQAVEQLEEDLVIADGEVAPLHQGIAKVAGEVSVLEIGLVKGTWGQEDRAGIVPLLGSQAPQRIAQRPKEEGQPLNAAIPKYFRQHARRDDAVLQGVTGARGRLRAIAKHVDGAVGAAAEVHCHQVEIAVAGQTKTVTGPQEAGIGKHELRRNQAGLEKLLRTVEVGENGFEQARALDEAGLQCIAFFRLNEHRERIELPGTIEAARIAVDVVGNAVFANQILGFLPAVAKLLVAQILEGRGERLPVLTQPASGVEHLVEAVQATIAIEKGPGVQVDLWKRSRAHAGGSKTRFVPGAEAGILLEA